MDVITYSSLNPDAGLDNLLTHPPTLSAANMHHWTEPSLVHAIACRLFSTKPLPESMLTYSGLNTWEHISVKFESEFYHFHSRKCIWKCRLPERRPFCSGENGLIRKAPGHSRPMRILLQCHHTERFYGTRQMPIVAGLLYVSTSRCRWHVTVSYVILASLRLIKWFQACQCEGQSFCTGIYRCPILSHRNNLNFVIQININRPQYKALRLKCAVTRMVWSNLYQYSKYREIHRDLFGHFELRHLWTERKLNGHCLSCCRYTFTEADVSTLKSTMPLLQNLRVHGGTLSLLHLDFPWYQEPLTVPHNISFVPPPGNFLPGLLPSNYYRYEHFIYK